VTHKEFDTIEEMVNHLENQYSITVLALRDYGSRAWNLDSETSDMDAGMVFTQEPIKYVELGGYTENIDRKSLLDGEEFELIGWNIKRFAELLNKSNPSMIEWLNSDIKYYEQGHHVVLNGEKMRVENVDLSNPNIHVPESKPGFEKIRIHANEEFKPISLFYHYRSMAKSNYTKYIENRNDLSIKRHLYILRGLTYARYVQKTHRMPPLDYTEFYRNQLEEMRGEEIPDMVYKYIGEFIRAKKNGEGERTIADQELWDWISNELDTKLDNEQHDVRGIDKEKVNNLIRSVV